MEDDLKSGRRHEKNKTAALWSALQYDGDTETCVQGKEHETTMFKRLVWAMNNTKKVVGVVTNT